MNIVLFGATGHVGRALAQETLQRGHAVTAVVRDCSRIRGAFPRLDVVVGDIAKPSTYADVLRHADAIIASISARRDGDNAAVPRAAETLLAAAAKAGVKRLGWVGGAGSLEAAPGKRVIDDPQFPEAWKAEAQGQVDALAVFRASQAPVDWVFASPAALLEDGERTGRYRLGGDQLLVDAHGKSRISIPDFAVALVDRIEQNDRARQRFTVADAA